MNIKKTEEEIMKRIEFIEGRLNAYLFSTEDGKPIYKFGTIDTIFQGSTA